MDVKVFYMKPMGQHKVAIGTPAERMAERYERTFAYTGTLHAWATVGEINPVDGGELYAVGIVEDADGEFEEVPVNLLERIKDEG